MKISAFEKNRKFLKPLTGLWIFLFLVYSVQPALAFPLGPLSIGSSEEVAQQSASASPKFDQNILPKLKFQPVSDAVISAGNLVEFKLQADSPATSPVRFEIEELPDGAFLMDGQFRWQPPAELKGEYKLNFHATDGVETVEQVITLFFLPESNPSRLAESVAEGARIQPTRQSALVLPGENGWIVVIPSHQTNHESEKRSDKDKPLKDEKGDGSLDDAGLRADSEGTKIAPNVTIAPGDVGFAGFGGFLGFTGTSANPSKNKKDDTGSPGETGSNPGQDGTDPGSTPPPPPSGNGGGPNFNLGIRFFDHLGVNNGVVPAFNPIEHHTFQSVNILGGIGNVFGRAAAFGDLEGHNNADASKNFQDIYVANPYRQIDLTGYSPAPATRNVFLANNAQPFGEITLTDRTLDFDAEHEPPSALDRPQAVLLGDLNSDGFRDIFIPNLGRPNVLLKNQGVGLPFADISGAAGIAETSEARAAVLADFNLDGDLDIYVANGSNANRLYMNLGNGTFLNAANLLGLEGTGRTVGVVTFDADNDGDTDIYLLNLSSPNRFYKNLLKETSALNFTEVSASAGLALSGTPSGAEIGDLDNDGDYDLFVSDLSAQGAKLLRNDSAGGNILFSDQTAKLVSAFGGGIPPTTGSAFLDIDNQGLLDVYVITENDENIMFGNNGNFNFSDITAQEIVAFPLFADSVATGDYNNDHKTDIFISSTPSLLYKNISQHSNHYLKILLEPTSVESNTDGIGARVEVTRSDGVKLTQQIIGGTGRSQDSNVLLFGMGNTTHAESVKVFWPDAPGRSTTLLDSDPAIDLHADQTLVITDNAAPEIMTLSDHFDVAEDVPSSFELATKDVNGNPVTLTFSVLSGTLGSGNGSIQKIVSDGINTTWRFTFTPSETGDITLRFSASDGLAPAPGTHDVTISVLSQIQFNHLPFFVDALPQSISVVAGEAMDEIDILARDSDNISTGMLNASVTVNPNLAPGSRPFLEDLNNPPVIISADGKSRAMKLKWTPAADLSGSFEVKVILDDGIGSAEDTLTILVEEPAPQLDVAPPVFVSSAPAGGSTVPELNSVEFLFSDNVNVDEAGTQVSVTRNGTPLTDTDFTRDDSQENKVVLTLNLPQDGTYVFSVTPRDVAGNTGAPVIVTLTDTSAPVPTLFKDQTLGQDGYFGAGPLPVAQGAVSAVVGDYDDDVNGVPSRSGAANTLEDLLILTDGNSANQLFRLTASAGPYQDTTISTGLPSAAADSRSAILADFNKDGAKDIFVANVHGDQLFLGNGNDTFAPDSAVSHGIQDDEEGNGALVGDVNNDGLLDLYVLNNGGPNILYLNRFNGTTLSFENVSGSTGTAGAGNENSVAGLLFDPDDDGDLDLYVVNTNAPDHLFLNPGPPVSPSDPFIFTDVAAQISLDEPLASAQVLKTADVDGDTDLDLLLLSSNPSEIKLLLHDQDHPATVDGAPFPTFTVSNTAGINLAGDISLGTPVMRDAVFTDFDNDSDADLIVAVSNNNDSQILLYENDGAGHFSLRTNTGLSAEDRVIRSLVSADINQDGRLDLISIGSESQIFLNQIVNGNAYLQIVLKGVVSNHLGLHTQVAVDPQSGGLSFSNILNAGTGRGQASNVLHFGLGNLGNRPAVIDHVIASWPRGTITLVENDGQGGPFFSDQRLIISELNNNEPVFMNVTVEHNPENQQPSPGLEGALQLVDISVDQNGNIVDGNGVSGGLVPFRQYVKVNFSLPDNAFSNVTLFTDNLNGDPAYQGTDHEKAAGLVGASDHTTVIPLLWKVFNANDTPNVFQPGSFIGDAGGFEGLVQDKAQSGYGELSSVVTREIVSNVNGGQLGLFPPGQVATRVLHPSNDIRVYLAADFSSPPSPGTWPPQDYKSSRITFELNVEGV